MEKSLLLEIVTPDKIVLSETVDYVGAPGHEGEFGILPNHIPFLAALRIGTLYYKASGKTRNVFVSGGFAEISDNKVSILAESAERVEDIDVARAQKAKERAEARLAKERDKIDNARAQAALQRAIQRINARHN